MKLDITRLDIRECHKEDLAQLLALQEDAFAHLENPDLLRRNTADMLRECLCPPHVTLGAFHNGELVAVTVLYVPEEDAEKLTPYLENVPCDGMASANYKLCIVRHDYRGNGLQYELGKRMEDYATARGFEILCATASPLNTHSVRNIERLGFSYNRTTEKYGLTRNLYYKLLRDA